MRLVLISVVIFVVSLVLVSAAVQVSCNNDAQCELATGEGSVCVENKCVALQKAPEQEEDTLRSFEVKGDITWGLFSYSEKESEELRCGVDGCINFAPQRTGNPIIDFFNWLLIVK